MSKKSNVKAQKPYTPMSTNGKLAFLIFLGWAVFVPLVFNQMNSFQYVGLISNKILWINFAPLMIGLFIWQFYWSKKQSKDPFKPLQTLRPLLIYALCSIVLFIGCYFTFKPAVTFTEAMVMVSAFDEQAEGEIYRFIGDDPLQYRTFYRQAAEKPHNWFVADNYLVRRQHPDQSITTFLVQSMTGDIKSLGKE